MYPLAMSEMSTKLPLWASFSDRAIVHFASRPPIEALPLLLWRSSSPGDP